MIQNILFYEAIEKINWSIFFLFQIKIVLEFWAHNFSDRMLLGLDKGLDHHGYSEMSIELICTLTQMHAGMSYVKNQFYLRKF